MYSDLGNQSQIFELTLKLGEIRQGEDNVTKYFNSLKRIWQDLDLFNTYEWKYAEDGLHHKKTMEDNRIFKFLVVLNVEFDEVRGRIIGRQPLPSIGEVFSEVRRKESRRNVMLGKKGPGVAIEGSTLVTTGGGYNKAAAFQRKSDERPRVWCDFCNKAILVRTVGKSMGNLQIGKEKQVTNQAEPLFLLLMRLRPAPSPLSKWSIFLHC